MKKLKTMLLTMGLLTLLGLGGVAYVDRYKDDKNSKGDVGLVMLMIAIGTMIIAIMFIS
jgi:hypothetical protein